MLTAIRFNSFGSVREQAYIHTDKTAVITAVRDGNEVVVAKRAIRVVPGNTMAPVKIGAVGYPYRLEPDKYDKVIQANISCGHAIGERLNIEMEHIQQLRRGRVAPEVLQSARDHKIQRWRNDVRSSVEEHENADDLAAIVEEFAEIKLARRLELPSVRNAGYFYKDPDGKHRYYSSKELRKSLNAAGIKPPKSTYEAARLLKEHDWEGMPYVRWMLQQRSTKHRLDFLIDEANPTGKDMAAVVDRVMEGQNPISNVWLPDVYIHRPNFDFGYNDDALYGFIRQACRYRNENLPGVHDSYEAINHVAPESMLEIERPHPAYSVSVIVNAVDKNGVLLVWYKGVVWDQESGTFLPDNHPPRPVQIPNWHGEAEVLSTVAGEKDSYAPSEVVRRYQKVISLLPYDPTITDDEIANQLGEQTLLYIKGLVVEQFSAKINTNRAPSTRILAPDQLGQFRPQEYFCRNAPFSYLADVLGPNDLIGIRHGIEFNLYNPGPRAGSYRPKSSFGTNIGQALSSAMSSQ